MTLVRQREQQAVDTPTVEQSDVLGVHARVAL